MEEMFKSQILDDLYEIRGEGLEGIFIKKYGKPKYVEKSQRAEEELIDTIKKIVKDEASFKEILEKLNEFEGSVLKEMCVWDRQYYKLGFVDGTYLKKEIRQERDKIEMDNSKDSIIHFNFNEISDFFEEQKYKNLKENKKYKNITKSIAEIKIKFPKIRGFLENDEITEFTKEEMKALLDVIGFYNDRAMYEADEMLKIGLREGKAL